MDPLTRRTLVLIESIVPTLGFSDRGRHLLGIVREYLEGGDVAEALRVLRTVDEKYLDQLPATTVFDRDVSVAVAAMVDAFGVDWELVLGEAEGSA